jgi:hypothetical protein
MAKDTKDTAPKEEVKETGIEQPRPPLPPIAVSPIPVVEKKTADTVSNPAQPFDHEYTDGVFVKNSGEASGEEFALCITKEPDAYGNTHFAKNSVHFWSGREVEFKLSFDKV